MQLRKKPSGVLKDESRVERRNVPIAAHVCVEGARQGRCVVYVGIAPLWPEGAGVELQHKRRVEAVHRQVAIRVAEELFGGVDGAQAEREPGREQDRHREEGKNPARHYRPGSSPATYCRMIAASTALTWPS